MGASCSIPALRTEDHCHRPGIASNDCVEHIVPLLAMQVIVATGLFWILSLRAERQIELPPAKAETVEFRVQLQKAIVPLVPLILLFLTGAPFYVLRVPADWLIVSTNSAEKRSSTLD